MGASSKKAKKPRAAAKPRRHLSSNQPSSSPTVKATTPPGAEKAGEVAGFEGEGGRGGGRDAGQRTRACAKR